MLINQSFEIPSCDDAELNIKRTSKLEYRISYDDAKEMKALVFIIGGYGANANISFLDFDRQYLAKNFPVVAINVFYHCFSHRRSNVEKYSAYKSFEKEDLDRIKDLLKKFNFAYTEVSNDNAAFLADTLVKHVENLKKQNQLEQDFKLVFTSTFIPPNEDYQNYGIMPAIDHINALKHLVKTYPEFKTLPRVMGGGSYGGYLSLLIAKISPWYVNAVIDNSGSVLPSPMFILGRESGQCEYVEKYPHNRIEFFSKTYWSADTNSKYFFRPENYIIRSLLNSSHLNLQARANKDIIFTSYHSLKDEFNTAKDKQILFSAYKELGYDATLNLIQDENQIDGKFIKDLKHGMRITDKALFKKELPLMLEKLKTRKSPMKENSISYPCGNKIFTFKDVGDKFELMIKEKNGNSE
ncbi:DUF2920 family protein [Campylobacter sp. VTCC 70190]|uniref:DUF2920 family protein n=1 Tax=Campylobacter sp. VTCC 70190 TaxID=3392118 RepID=UPI00398E70BA